LFSAAAGSSVEGVRSDVENPHYAGALQKFLGCDMMLHCDDSLSLVGKVTAKNDEKQAFRF
jgi:hypothetical protein